MAACLQTFHPVLHVHVGIKTDFEQKANQVRVEDGAPYFALLTEQRLLVRVRVRERDDSTRLHSVLTLDDPHLIPVEESMCHALRSHTHSAVDSS